MTEEIVSRRGVYRDLEKSPYEFTTLYGDSFKFSSKKKLEMYQRDIETELKRLDKAISRNDMESFIPVEIYQLLRKAVYESLYKKIEG